jgi:heme-degrading monooxygenase HmoA
LELAVELSVLLKLIECVVDPSQTRAFAEAQRTWQSLELVRGFCAQVGGWRDDGELRTDAPRAAILGWWRDREAYDRFMRETHDGIVAKSRQNEMYRSIEVSLWDGMDDIPGACADWSDRCHKAGLLRIARCTVRAGRDEHFVNMQRTHWNPGMASAPGMLGGVFGRAADASNEYLVCTFWRSVESHRDYRDGIFPGLRADSDVDVDCDFVLGALVTVEPGWVVTASG